jgi:hypothetical protein
MRTKGEIWTEAVELSSFEDEPREIERAKLEVLIDIRNLLAKMVPS